MKYKYYLVSPPAFLRWENYVENSPGEDLPGVLRNVIIYFKGTRDIFGINLWEEGDLEL